MTTNNTEHEPGCPRLLFWDAGEFQAPCTCGRPSPATSRVDTKEPFNLSKPPHLIANELIRRIEARNDCIFGKETHADVEQLVTQMRDAKIAEDENAAVELEQAQQRIATLERELEQSRVENERLQHALTLIIDCGEDATSHYHTEDTTALFQAIAIARAALAPAIDGDEK